MSDTAKKSDTAKSSAEIEDVLSSIRRLVSEHHLPEAIAKAPVARPAQGDRPAAQSDKRAQADKDDKLLLTPALRVMDPDDPWAPVPRSPDLSRTAEAAPDRTGAAPFAPEDKLSDWGDVSSESRAAASDAAPAQDQAEAIETETAEAAMAEPFSTDAPSEDISETDLQDLRDLDGLTSADDGFEPETGDDDWPDPTAHGALRHLAAARGSEWPKDDAAGPNAAHESSAEFPSESDDDDPPMHMADEQSSDADVAEENEADDDMANEDAAGENMADEGMTPETDAQDTVADEAEADRIAPDYGADTDADGTIEVPSDGGFTPIFARRSAMHPSAEGASASLDAEAEPDAQEIADTADNATADAPDETRQEAEAAAPQAETGSADRYRAYDRRTYDTDDDIEDLGDGPSPFLFPDAEDGVLDEDTLREIIVDVVREELQGALGQRITRNVRKMVRREIRLALAAEELE